MTTQNRFLSDMIAILSTPPYQRSQKQLKTLISLTKNIQFFIKQIQDSGEAIHTQMCMFMGYEFLGPNCVIDK